MLPPEKYLRYYSPAFQVVAFDLAAMVRATMGLGFANCDTEKESRMDCEV